MAFVGQVRAGDVTGRIGSSLYGVCATAANVAAKEVAIEGLDTLIPGLTIHVKFTNSNRTNPATEPPTLTIPTIDNVARRIYRHGTVPPGMTDRESWYAGTVVALTYDGTAWEMNDWQSDTLYDLATQSAAGLMSATDKTVVDNRTTSLTFQNVPTSTWESDTVTYPSYPYKATLSCPGVTANHFAQVCFNPEHVLNYVMAPVCQTGADTVTVWAMIDPGASITVPTVFAVLPDR